MSLTCVTITGADDSIHPSHLSQLSDEFPFVEWAILIGSRTQNRFPSVEWISQLIEQRYESNNEIRLSLHVCGSALREIASGTSSLEKRLGPMLCAFGRVQLNWHGEKQRQETGENVLQAFCGLGIGGWEPELIFQLDGVNDNIWVPASRRFLCSGLFDCSHGAGVLPGEWPQSRVDLRCGWAGGLGPHNLAEEIPKIDSKAFSAFEYWIDIETHVRAEDDAVFDISKVRKCLEISKPFVSA